MRGDRGLVPDDAATPTGRGRRSARPARGAHGCPSPRPACGSSSNDDAAGVLLERGSRAGSRRRAVRAEHVVGLLPVGVDELVGADEEDGVVVPRFLERVDREGMPSSSTVAPSGSNASRAREPVLRRSDRPLVAASRARSRAARRGRTPHRRLRERDVAGVRRVEAPAEDADHCQSSSRRRPRPLPRAGAGGLRPPPALRPGAADDAKAAVGAEDPVRRPRRRCGR